MHAGYAYSEDSKAVKFNADVPLFVEQARQAGITHQYDGPWEYFVGGGISTFDCNQDRMPDVFIAGGKHPSALYINSGKVGGALKFTHLQDSKLSLGGVLGSYPLDIDNDAYLDLIILRVGENQLYKGGPNCQFRPANALWKFKSTNAWSTAFAATYEPEMPHPTLAIGNYVDRTAPGSPWGTCQDNELYRPEAVDGTVDNTIDSTTGNPDYSSVQLLSPGFCTLSMLFTDWNKSGRDALRITNDRHYYRGGQEQLWRLDKGQYARVYSRAEGWEPLVIWGMGIAESDLDADGYPEYALTSMGDTKLQKLDVQQAVDENRPVYEDTAWSRGVTAHRPYTGDDSKPSTGWHAEFADVNNDSHIDLFIAKGNVENMADFASFDPDNLLMGSPGGTFFEKGLESGLAKPTRGRGASITDFNADGLLDIIVVNRGANVSVFRNTGMIHQSRIRQAGNWLKIELRQPGVNRHAIGARVSIKTGNHVQTRRIQIGGGHASGGIGFMHIGLGVAERATIRVQWPDGQWSAPYKLFANHHMIIERHNDSAMQWFPVP